MNGLTKRQREVLLFIENFIAVEKIPPTLREICGHFGFRTTSGAIQHLEALERKGYIMTHAKVARGIRVLKSGRPSSPPIPIELPKRCPRCDAAYFGERDQCYGSRCDDVGRTGDAGNR